MLLTLLVAPLLASAAVADDDLPDFAPSQEAFTSAEACRDRLRNITTDARGTTGFEAAEGPYPMGGEDFRAHYVTAEGRGHRVFEFRCLGRDLSARDWPEVLELPEPEFDPESVARRIYQTPTQ